ncbi:conserved protein of unknown function [Magnetospirillum gryphiswaldense MSR-1 v2]|uniref:Uncharacterized protein n=1 Tax=Magnetospirillum gryphiswaldense (strain DSM 6361 / JCM 21280 / NBRC 15271 / MSR-1) TaxID=431944 RepID=V6F2Y6_MAGGM|nr:conserved protein of unknown function [Magnetospirillum gryphiswaldense MSR-1 v2]
MPMTGGCRGLSGHPPRPNQPALRDPLLPIKPYPTAFQKLAAIADSRVITELTASVLICLCRRFRAAQEAG